MTRTVLLTGATGFIGSHVRALLERDPGIALRAMAHRTPPPAASSGAMWVRADLGRPEELTGVCDGVDTLVHLASYIGPDEARCDLVNRLGTEALVAQALRSGTKNIDYLSTAAVYGAGTHSGIPENAHEPAPVSAVSRSRLAAERPVLEAGGIVLRPMFVYGEGDRWFLPRGTIHHANHPVPVTTRDLDDPRPQALGRPSLSRKMIDYRTEDTCVVFPKTSHNAHQDARVPGHGLWNHFEHHAYVFAALVDLARSQGLRAGSKVRHRACREVWSANTLVSSASFMRRLPKMMDRIPGGDS